MQGDRITRIKETLETLTKELQNAYIRNNKDKHSRRRNQDVKIVETMDRKNFSDNMANMS